MSRTLDEKYFQKLSNLVDAKQAAEYLMRSTKTLAMWRTEGIGPCFIKLRGKVYYYLDDLNAWLDTQLDERYQSTAEARSK